MINKYSNLYNAVILEKKSNFYSCKIKTFIIKNTKEKSKNKNKKIEPKIINDFLVYKFIIFWLFKPKKIMNYY